MLDLAKSFLELAYLYEFKRGNMFLNLTAAAQVDVDALASLVGPFAKSPLFIEPLVRSTLFIGQEVKSALVIGPLVRSQDGEHRVDESVAMEGRELMDDLEVVFGFLFYSSWKMGLRFVICNLYSKMGLHYLFPPILDALTGVLVNLLPTTLQEDEGGMEDVPFALISVQLDSMSMPSGTMLVLLDMMLLVLDKTLLLGQGGSEFTIG